MTDDGLIAIGKQVTGDRKASLVEESCEYKLFGLRHYGIR
jgi:hypothetical protein